jgi:hypothetical protein
MYEITVSFLFQYFLTVIPPVWIRTYIGGFMNEIFRQDYFKGVPKE